MDALDPSAQGCALTDTSGQRFAQLPVVVINGRNQAAPFTRTFALTSPPTYELAGPFQRQSGIGLLEAMLSLMVLSGLLLVMIDQLGASYRQQQQLQRYDLAHWAVADLLARLEQSNSPSVYSGTCPMDEGASDWAQWCAQARRQLGSAFHAQAHWRSGYWQLELQWSLAHPPLTVRWVQP